MIWKERLARWLQFRGLQRLMVWGIYLVIPRHRIGINIVALDSANRVLLLKHVFHPACPWGLPGGWLGRHEDPRTAALRELEEETGLTAVLGPPIFTTYDAHPPHIGIIYLAAVQSGEMQLSGEILDAGWFPVQALPQPLSPTVRQAIDTAVARKGDNLNWNWYETEE